MGKRFWNKKNNLRICRLLSGFKDTEEIYFIALAEKAALPQLPGFFANQESVLIYPDGIISFFKMSGWWKRKLYIFWFGGFQGNRQFRCKSFAGAVAGNKGISFGIRRGNRVTIGPCNYHIQISFAAFDNPVVYVKAYQ